MGSKAREKSARRTPRSGSAREPREGALRCDFCGERVPRVRRVALDRDYDRLRTPHRELYACPSCSERKERMRRGL